MVPLAYERPKLPCNQSPESKPADKSDFELLFLGQINLRKGIARLIQAMRLLQRRSKVRLTLAGPTEVDPQLWSGVSNVRWVGPLQRSQTRHAYQRADAFILPTLSDGYALTQLEALSHGLPVIASQHCGAAVEHGKNGWLLENLEPETIAETIQIAAEARLGPSQIDPTCFTIDDLSHALSDLVQ